MSRITGDEPVVTDDRDQTLALISAIASAISVRVVASSWWKVRNTVESDGTDPNRSDWRRRCSMSAQLSPPPASIRAVCTRTLPRSWTGSRSPVSGIRAESESPRPNRSAKQPRACSPTWATTPVPPGSTITWDALIPFTLEVPSCC